MDRSEVLALCFLTGAVIMVTAALRDDPGGLKLEASHKSSIEASVSVSTISGTILNASGRTLSVPNVRVALCDVRGAEIWVREAPPSRRSLGPGDRATFSARFEDPPPHTISANVQLVGSEQLGREKLSLRNGNWEELTAK